MKKTNLLITLTAAVFCGGCVAIEQPHVSPKPQRLPQGSAPVRMTTQANANFSVAGEVNTKMRVFFVSSSAEKIFSSKLAGILSERVVLDKAQLCLNSAGDIMISLLPEFELIDKSGEYYRVNCRQISVVIASRQKVLARKIVMPEALPRKLGVQNAKNQYLASAAGEIVPFLKKELERISREEVAVGIVDFALANIQEQPEPRKIAQQVNKIVHILSTLPGVINFTNIKQDVPKAACSFRVVYLRDQFPQGLTNVLNLKLAGK